MTAAPDPAQFRPLLGRFCRARKGESEAERDARWLGLLRRLQGPVKRRLFAEFFHWRAHGGQNEPAGDWTIWLLMAGRGFGKTLAGAHWVCDRARETPEARIALVGATVDEVVKVMIEGPSGLLAAARAEEEMFWLPTRGIVSFASGAEAFVYSAAAGEKLRGPEHHFAWCDELAKWESSRGCGDGGIAWDNLMMGLRKGERPRTIVTTTPRATALLRRVRALKGCVETGGTMEENVHLARAVRDWAIETYGGTRLGRQELDGVLFDEPEGALFPREILEKARVAAFAPPVAGVRVTAPEAPYLKRGAGRMLARLAPELRRVVVGVDPPAKAGGNGCGIVVCGLGADDVAYVLDDCSVAGLRPEGWARAVAAAADAWGADRVIAEANQGGEMVESVLRAADCALPVKLVSASRGKAARAEPVAARFEKRLARLAGRFPALEDELAGLTLAGGYEGPGKSPDRADAMVWAMSELIKPRREPRIRRL